MFGPPAYAGGTDFITIRTYSGRAGSRTQPRWGWVSMQTVSQGSREARQPWAMLRNRFAVLTERS